MGTFFECILHRSSNSFLTRLSGGKVCEPSPLQHTKDSIHSIQRCVIGIFVYCVCLCIAILPPTVAASFFLCGSTMKYGTFSQHANANLFGIRPLFSRNEKPFADKNIINIMLCILNSFSVQNECVNAFAQQNSQTNK